MKSDIAKTKALIEACFLKNDSLKREIAKLEKQMANQYDGLPASSRDILLKLDRTIVKLTDDIESERRETERVAKKPTPTPGSTLAQLC